MKFTSRAETKTYLLNANSQDVFNWFKNNNTYSWNYLESVENEKNQIWEKQEGADFAFLTALLNKKNDLITLALAKYTNDFDFLKIIYENTKDEGIRIALLSNEGGDYGSSHMFGNYGYDENKLLFFIKHSTDEEKYAFFSNTNFGDQLEELYKRENIFEKISEKLWCDCIAASRSNPKIAKSYDDMKKKEGSRYTTDDGWASHRSQSVIEALWDLPAKVKVNDMWNYCFHLVFDKAYYSGRSTLVENEIKHIEVIFERWKNLFKGGVLNKFARSIMGSSSNEEIGDFIKNYNHESVTQAYIESFNSMNASDDADYIKKVNKKYPDIIRYFAMINPNLMSRRFPKMSKAYYEIIYEDKPDQEYESWDTQQINKDGYEFHYKKRMEEDPSWVFNPKENYLETDIDNNLFINDEETFTPTDNTDHEENIALGIRVVKHHSLQILNEARNKEVDNKKLWNSLGKLFKEKSEVDNYIAKTNINLQSKILKNLDTLTKLTGSIKTLLQYVFITGLAILIFLLFN